MINRMLLEAQSPYDAFRWAEELFSDRDYYGAAEILRHLVETHGQSHEQSHELGAVRELLARSYYHSAQLGRAVEAAREALAHEPTNSYVALLLARSLERSSRLEEADRARRLAEALGAVA